MVDVCDEVVGGVWCYDVVVVCCFYEDAVFVVCDGDEGCAYAWDLVVSAVEAGAEQSEADWNQRALRGLDGVEWDGFGAADDA